MKRAFLNSIGFGSNGVTKGSYAASYQSHCGNVQSGSIFSRLTSAGMKS